MSGGGSESSSTSYGYLPYVTPEDSEIIGGYQVRAAQQASVLAQQQMANAIASINQNFTSANNMLQPYSTQGVQATNELNRYLGLSPYNPGSAPEAPKTPTIDDFMKNIDHQQVLDYIHSHSNKVRGVGEVYRGVGSGPGGMTPQQWQGASYKNPLVAGNTELDAIIRAELARPAYEAAQTIHDSQMGQYQKDLEAYNQNKAWFDQYSASGPYTASQITENVTNQPGYKAQFDEGINAVQKAASARGLLGSGNMLKDLTSFASQLEGQYYSDMLNRLSQQAAQGAQAAGQASQNYTGQGSVLSQLRSQLGDTLANAVLSAGQANAAAYQLGNTKYRQVVTGQSSSSSSGGGLSGIGSVLGGIGSLGSMFSSRTYKTKGKNPHLDLKKLNDLPVEKWKYKKSTNIDPTGQTHIGPYAEDFQKVFGVGDGKSIPVVSAVGILYGLVKELYKKVETK